MSLPLIVTHPSTIFHNGLRQLFSAKSGFRPVRITTALTPDLESYIGTLESCVWLAGVESCTSTINPLIRKLVAANPNVKVVVLSGTIESADIMSALQAGACGFLCQNIPGETLLRSLELITHGQMIVHAQAVWHQAMAKEQQPKGKIDGSTDYGNRQLASQVPPLSPLGNGTMANDQQTSDIPSLSRRETLILRMLMQGSSNKVIARTLVITESTVKVHMKAILRKLRLQNRTQAALWARNNVNEGNFSEVTGNSTH
jgi:two-component system, NarL family, nitrate/nitrite response regulator NarL